MTRTDLAGVGAKRRQLRGEKRPYVEQGRDRIGRRTKGVGLEAPEIRGQPPGVHQRDESPRVTLRPRSPIEPGRRATAQESKRGIQKAGDREVVRVPVETLVGKA